MKLIDTHTHLYLEVFDNDIEQVLEKAINEGVQKFYLPAIDSSEFEHLLNLETKFPTCCFAMMGLHPCSVKENFEQELALVEEALSKRKFAAVGEIGLDFYWDKSFTKEQYACFHKQIEFSILYNLPIVIHSRDSLDEAIDVINEYKGRGVYGIFHCFGGSIEQANKIIETGFYLGIGGVITYKKSGLAEVLSRVDLQHVVLETDAPYLTPVPFRGKRNESSYLKFIVAKIAEIKNVTVEEVARVTTENAEKIFR